MKIFYIAGREGSYSRTRNVLNGLRENGVEKLQDKWRPKLTRNNDSKW